MTPTNRPTGMRAFTLIWLGQIVSLIGTAMTQFGVTIWAWQMTGQATTLALAGFFAFAPQILLSPLAGALTDRWNRKLVMMLSDLAAGLVTIALMLLFITDSLQIWHLFLANAISGAFQAFQFPAYSAAISTMIPKTQYGRASGMMSLAETGSGVFAPVLAGTLYGFIGLGGIMLVDIVTFLIALGTLLVVFIPQPKVSADGQAARGSLWQDAIFGFRYIFGRSSLLGLQMVFFFINLTGMLGFTLFAAMILARTGDNELALGSVQSAGAIGGVVGSLLLSTWGGPKRRVHGILIGMTLSGLLGQIILGLGRSLPVWAAAAFMTSFFLPIINGSNQAIWQAKVPPDIQGRVFAARRLIAQLTIPAAMLIAGPLADRVFEPAMQVGGLLVPAFGGLVGSGPGAGMGLIFVITGALSVLVGLGGYAFHAVRNAEDILVDHDADALAAVEGQPA